MQHIVCKIIPHLEQRYDTVGDYWEDPDGTTQFRVSDMGDMRYNISVFVHELIEYALLLNRGVAEPEVLAFDLAVPKDSPYADDPGFDPKAPYHKEHVFSDTIERLLAQQWGVNWGEFNKAMENLPDWSEHHEEESDTGESPQNDQTAAETT